MARLIGHRQTKEAATDKPNLPPPRHIPTLPISDPSRCLSVFRRNDGFREHYPAKIGHHLLFASLE